MKREGRGRKRGEGRRKGRERKEEGRGKKKEGREKREEITGAGWLHCIHLPIICTVGTVPLPTVLATLPPCTIIIVDVRRRRVETS